MGFREFIQNVFIKELLEDEEYLIGIDKTIHLKGKDKKYFTPDMKIINIDVFEQVFYVTDEYHFYQKLLEHYSPTREDIFDIIKEGKNQDYIKDEELFRKDLEYCMDWCLYVIINDEIGKYNKGKVKEYRKKFN